MGPKKQKTTITKNSWNCSRSSPIINSADSQLVDLLASFPCSPGFSSAPEPLVCGDFCDGGAQIEPGGGHQGRPGDETVEPPDRECRAQRVAPEPPGTEQVRVFAHLRGKSGGPVVVGLAHIRPEQRQQRRQQPQ